MTLFMCNSSSISRTETVSPTPDRIAAITKGDLLITSYELIVIAKTEAESLPPHIRCPMD